MAQKYGRVPDRAPEQRQRTKTLNTLRLGYTGRILRGKRKKKDPYSPAGACAFRVHNDCQYRTSVMPAKY